MIIYPDKPWTNGQEFSHVTNDNDTLIGTYDLPNNTWSFRRLVSPSAGRSPIFSDVEPTSHPDYVGVESQLIVGDVWYDTSDADIIRYVWDGTSWVVYSDAGSLQTSTTLPLGNQPSDTVPDPDSLARLHRKEREDGLLMQSDLNYEQFYTLFNQRRKATRNKTTVDFLQNTVTEGDWEYEPADQGAALPEAGYFHLFGANGVPTSNWSEVKLININGTGRNSESLAEIRRGAVINMQDVQVNSFAQYVVQRVAFIGNPEGGQFWIEMEVLPRYNRAVGIVPDGAVCELQVISQYPCITTANKIAPPKVNNDGYLWYDEDTMTLYVSNWDDVQSPNGSCTWICVDGTHLIREVLYVGKELTPNTIEGSVLSGDGTTWYLSGSRFPLNPGMKIIIADAQTTIVSVETKDIDGFEYREITTSDSITLDDSQPYETRFTAPQIGGHPYWEDLHNQSGTGGSEVHVGENPPDEVEGSLWFDTTRLELYVYYVEGEDGGWLPSSPLGARVSAGEAKQLELEGRISQGEQRQAIIQGTIGAIQEDYLSKEQEVLLRI